MLVKSTMFVSFILIEESTGKYVLLKIQQTYTWCVIAPNEIYIRFAQTSSVRVYITRSLDEIEFRVGKSHSALNTL